MRRQDLRNVFKDQHRANQRKFVSKVKQGCPKCGGGLSPKGNDFRSLTGAAINKNLGGLSKLQCRTCGWGAEKST